MIILPLFVTGIINPAISGMNDPKKAPGLFGSALSAITGFFLTIATIWAFIQLLLGAVNWISSGGDKTKLEEARHRIQNAILGLFIMFTVWSIFLIILSVLGISSGGGFNIQFPTLFE